MAGFIENYQAVVALAILAATFVLFLMELFPPSAVAAFAVAAYLGLGLLTADDALSVLSNSAPITVAAMFVLSGALVRTGVLEEAGRRITLRAKDHPVQTFIIVIAGTMLASAFMNNTPVVMVLIPVVIRLALAVGWASTQVLIPLSYAAILGGTLTLIGTSTNLLVAGVAEREGLAPFTLFEITPVGLFTASIGAVAMLLFSRFLLPERATAAEVVGDNEKVLFFSELTVAADAPFIGAPLKSVAELNRPDIRILALRRPPRVFRVDVGEQEVRAGDRIIVMTTMTELLGLRTEKSFVIAGSSSLEAIKTARHRITVEAVVAPGRGGPIGTVKDLRLRRFGVQILGVHRHLHIPGPDLNSIRLRAADRVLLEGSPEGLAAAADETNLINISETRARGYRRRKAPVAIGALAGVVLLSSFGVLPIMTAAILAIAVILLLRCVDAEEAWHAIDGGILILIFAMLAIGIGLEKTGALDLIVGALMPMLQSSPPWVVLVSVYLMAHVMTEFVTNNAVAVILTPIAIGLAESLGLDARPLVVAVMFGASSSFATPIGYQTNTMVYGAGNYRFTDFLKVGLPMSVIAGTVSCTAIYFLMPMR